MAVVKITSENFEQEVMNSDKPVLIDFWASWCGPCKMLSPIVDEIGEEVDYAKIAKINVDEEGDLASKFRVMSIPTLVYLKNGKVIETSVGVKTKSAILDILKK